MEAFKGYGETHMTADELRRFVRFGDPGQWCTYFKGVALPYRPGAMWELAWELHKAGYLELAQRRLTKRQELTGIGRPAEVGTFEYMCCRTSKPWIEPERAAKTKAMMRA